MIHVHVAFGPPVGSGYVPETGTKVKVCPSPTFLGWVFQWDGKVRIVAPQSAVDEYLLMVKKAIGDNAI